MSRGSSLQMVDAGFAARLTRDVPHGWSDFSIDAARPWDAAPDQSGRLAAGHGWHSDPVVTCRHCHSRIVGCIGVHGDWKHLHDSMERCGGGGTLAQPPLVIPPHLRYMRSTYYTAGQVAAALGVGRSTVIELCDRGEMRARRSDNGRFWKIHKDDLVEWLANQP